MEEALQGGTKALCSAVGVAWWAVTRGGAPGESRQSPWTEVGHPSPCRASAVGSSQPHMSEDLSVVAPSQFRAPRVHRF